MIVAQFFWKLRLHDFSPKILLTGKKSRINRLTDNEISLLIDNSIQIAPERPEMLYVSSWVLIRVIFSSLTKVHSAAS